MHLYTIKVKVIKEHNLLLNIKAIVSNAASYNIKATHIRTFHLEVKTGISRNVGRRRV